MVQKGDKSLSLFLLLLSVTLYNFPFVNSQLINNPNLPLISPQQIVSGSGSNDWNDLINVPAGFADGVDDTVLGGTDGNNYTYGGNVTGATTKTINLFVAGGPNVSFTFNDNDADTDTFQANYSDYLNTKNYTTNGTFYLASNPSNFITDGNTNWDNSYGFIDWSNAINGTLALASQLSNYVPLASLVTLVGNWTLDKTDYFTKSDIIGFSYYNSSDFDINSYYLSNNPYQFYNETDFNISDYYLDSNPDNFITDGNTNWDNSYGFITWANAINGTLALASDLLNYVATANLVTLVGNWTLDKPNYFTKANIIGLNYWNDTYATFNKTYADTLYYSSANPSGYITDGNTNWDNSYGFITGYTETDPYWSGNYSSVARVGDCPTGQIVMNITNTGVECITPAAGAEVDPYWTSNFTAHNSSWSSTFNSTYNAYNSTGLIRDWNVTGLIINWNASGDIKNWNATGHIKDWNATGLIKDYSGLGYITNATMNKTVSCSSITGGSDSDFCADATGTGGGGLEEYINYTLNATATTSNTVWLKVDNLTTTLEANNVYLIKCDLFVFGAAATTGGQLNVTINGTAPNIFESTYCVQVSTTARTCFQGTSTSSNTYLSTGSAGVSIRDSAPFQAYVVTGSGDATLNYYIKSEVSASNAGFARGSYCRYTKVAW